jgi:hypothetical protein
MPDCSLFRAGFCSRSKRCRICPMPVLELNSIEFHDLAHQILRSGHRIRFQAKGESMQPFIRNSDILEVVPILGKRIHLGDVLLVEASEGRLLAHRVVKTGCSGSITVYLIKSDMCDSPDGWFGVENILGRVEVVERGNQRIVLSFRTQYWKARIWVWINPWGSNVSWMPKWFRYRIRDWLFMF